MVPEIIKEVGFDFHWSEEKVWKLDYPSEKMNVAELEWHFKIPFIWNKKEYDLNPIDVIENPSIYKKEYERTMNADLIHPIDVMKNKGRWLILDGLHRLMKAKALSMKEVSVRKIPRKEIPNIKI
ncbi:ParB N-terminal domain-containing protein [Candidatus Micrarchaeota archaeon]|nr:ParB N-terminal domain-containing protein [Candidatus Micrarchaeota archaeon]